MQGKKHIPASRLHLGLRKPERKLIEEVTSRGGYRSMTAMVLSSVRMMGTAIRNQQEGGAMMFRSKDGTYTRWSVGL